MDQSTGKIALHTLGCRLNYAETSTVGERFRTRGFEIVEIAERPDVVFINSCTVTNNADRECRQIVRRALRSNPEACVIVTGCYAQLRPEEIASIDGVDYVLGSREKFRVDELVEDFSKQAVPKIHVGDLTEGDDFGPAHTGAGDDRTRAFLKVQDGCDYNCSFCTIPLARGASRSQSVDGVLENAGRLVAAGYREIVLTGVNTGDYGRKIGTSLAHLLERLHEVDRLERLRISSIEPNLLTDEIIDLVATSPIMPPHFHVPLQSGSDRLLRSMRRRYRTDHYRRLVDRIRQSLPDCGLGIDVIVGFPGESEEIFEETVSFLQEIAPSYLHVFTYSERENTPAAEYAEPVDLAVRRERTTRLRSLSDMFRSRFAEAYEGSVRPVLPEGRREDGRVLGYTDNFIRVDIEGYDADRSAAVCDVLLGAWDGEACRGSLAATAIPV